MVKKYLPLIFCVLLCLFVGFSSTGFTISAIANWYLYLHKPFFSPPNWLFGPVWTFLYISMGIALSIIWNKGRKKKKVRFAIQLFMIQLGLNFTWSYLFFGLHSPLLGLIGIVLLYIFILKTMRAFRPLSKTAFNLLIPYTLWVSFASLLNLSILILN